MVRRVSDENGLVRSVQKWFRDEVSYEGEPYVMDEEQAAAVVDDSWNALVVARAGSGKTRTIVAKIVYLVAQQGIKPEEIKAFVFNTNAAAEINERLSKMMVGGKALITGEVKIASTFHAFARGIVYEACEGKDRCGKILANEKGDFIMEIVRQMARERKWQGKMAWFVDGKTMDGQIELAGERGKVVVGRDGIPQKELAKFTKRMTQFVNRAQQKFLGGTMTVREVAEEYISKRNKKNKTRKARNSLAEDESKREQVFIELGVEVFRRYHWWLLDEKRAMKGFSGYGTDFNLIVSWASKLIWARRGNTVEMLTGVKYILIDEYQDFSQLFLAAVEAIRSIATEAKLFVVGDDLQAINRFAGSDVEYFKNFEHYFPDEVRRYEISTNYRCDKEIIATARKFMMKAMQDKGKFRAYSKKRGKVIVVNPLETKCGLALVEHDARVSAEDKIYQQIARRAAKQAPERDTVRYIKTIVKLLEENKKAEKIFLLHRNNEMNIDRIKLTALSKELRWGVAQLGVMSVEEYEKKVKVTTMHKSKGLEAEVVIILEADDGVIPKTHPDIKLYGMFGETDEVAILDQKRLFYVAMTRAKRRLYIIHRQDDGEKPGGFVRYL